MPSPKHFLTAVLATALLLAAPSTALAQSAGDQQYADPLSDTPSQNDSGGDQNSGSQGNPDSGSQGSTGSGTAGSTQGQAAPAAPQGAAAQNSGQALPRTGSDSALLLAAGAVLLGSGMLVRLGVTARRAS